MEAVVPYFDCALCNHYPNAESACKFHTDPEHGTVWERLTCVVAAGDPRTFAFRPIHGGGWSDWDEVQGVPTESEAAAIPLFPGDVVLMWGSCNDDFYHAVYADPTLEDVRTNDTHNGRVSLVLKRAVDRNGIKGHGLLGEGRRARNRAKSKPQPTIAHITQTPHQNKPNVRTKTKRPEQTESPTSKSVGNKQKQTNGKIGQEQRNGLPQKQKKKKKKSTQDRNNGPGKSKQTRKLKHK
mmetsp:Transcript_16476/g.20092  ORF Transcript_16476/g.20092 Transcript_16476/m.20092 type:complete len:239 (+) Transcript_16476:324-1040(+)